jgi:hypothetical protein
LSAIFGGVQALGGAFSAYAAIKQANFAERQAQAAEDPPIQEPTTGGVSSDHTEVPEVKGVKISKEPIKDVRTEEEDITTTTPPSKVKVAESETTEEKPQKEGEPKKSTTTGTKTTAIPEQTTTSHGKKTITTVKDADQPDKETTPFTVLRLSEGKTNSQADFTFTLRYNGTDVRGGATKDGEINGYLGGTNNSNASVKFKASPGKHLDDGTATVRLLFGGTNVPPRKKAGLPTGFLDFGAGGTETAKDYVVQRFSASAVFSGKGELVTVNPPKVTPRDRSTVAPGDGVKAPLVSIGLNVEAGPPAPGPAPAPPVPAPKAAPPRPAPSPVSPGGPK